MDKMKVKMKVKLFYTKHKTIIIAVASTIVGGLIVYGLTNSSNKRRDHETEGQHILNVLKDSMNENTAVVVTKSISNNSKNDYDVPSFEAAIDKFKEYQETNDTVAMFWENETYSVLDLEPKADDVEKEVIKVLDTATDGDTIDNYDDKEFYYLTHNNDGSTNEYGKTLE